MCSNAEASIVIHGPQGCGKGIHAPIMARHFGCKQIIDDWNGTDPVPAGAMVLTNLASFVAPPGATVVAFSEAMKQAGLRTFAGLSKADQAYGRVSMDRLRAAISRPACE